MLTTLRGRIKLLFQPDPEAYSVFLEYFPITAWDEQTFEVDRYANAYELFGDFPWHKQGVDNVETHFFDHLGNEIGFNSSGDKYIYEMWVISGLPI